MELQWSHASSVKHGAAGEGFSIRNSRTDTQILERNPEDDFECTYFRRRTTRSPTKAKKGGGLFPMTICYTLPSELSDGYTDSESESDNTSNVERWLESLPANDAWSSAPNYSALDGSEALEGNDEIQEDSKKSRENDSGSCPNYTNDSGRSFTPETGGSKVQMTGSDLAKRLFNGPDEISVIAEWLDRKTPRKKIKRTLKTHQKMPLWTKVEQEAGTDIEKEKSLGSIRKQEPCLVLRKADGNPGRKTAIDETAVRSKNNTLETTEIKTAIKKTPTEENGYDEMMQKMVNQLLTVPVYREEKTTGEQIIEKAENESFSSIDSVRDFKNFCDSKKSEETVDSSLSRPEIKRARYSATLEKSPSKSAKTKINGNQRSKVKKDTLKTRIQIQNPKLMRKIKPAVTKHQLKSIQKPRYAITSQKLVENIDPGKKKPQSRTVRFQDEVATSNSSETWRRAARIKTARNNKILHTVKQIVGDIQSGGLQFGKKYIFGEPGEAQMMSKKLMSEQQEPGDKIESNKYGSWKSNRKRLMHLMDSKTIGSKKPVFSNPFVENCLDKAMDLALSKYKRSQNTWANFNKEKLRENISSTTYEPPPKKLKPKSFTSKLENMQHQDFSLLKSWQSIHNYFLSYSSCK